jgi:N-acetylmuramoyl-L-alanine amidase
MAKIYSAAGHGGKDSGAVGNGLKEKDLTLAVTLELHNFLALAGHTVFTYRLADTDYDLTSAQRVDNVAKIANEANSDFFIDVHFNGSTDPSANGVECYYSMHEKTTTAGFKIATELCSSFANKFGLANRGAKTKITKGADHFGVIRQTNMPAILFECCFISNVNDMSKYNAKEFARVIATSICKVFGGTVPQSDTQATPQSTQTPQVDTKQVDIDSLKNQVNSLNTELTKVKADKAIIDKQAQDRTLDVAKNLKTIETLEKSIVEKDKQIANLNLSNQQYLDNLGKKDVKIHAVMVENEELLVTIKKQEEDMQEVIAEQEKLCLEHIQKPTVNIEEKKSTIFSLLIEFLQKILHKGE